MRELANREAMKRILKPRNRKGLDIIFPMEVLKIRNISHIGAVLTGLCEAIREKLLMKNKNLFFCDKQKNCTIEQ